MITIFRMIKKPAKLFRLCYIVILPGFLILVLSAELIFARDLHKPASIEHYTSSLDKRIPALMKDYDIPGVIIALVDDGRYAWSKAYGYAELEAERKMTVDTFCRMESISKPVVAWGVMKLVEQGMIDLDAPAARYLKTWEFPESKYPAEAITVRHLLSHSAGLPLGNISDRYPPDGDVPSPEESLTKYAVPAREPGTFFYSNAGFNLLELIVEDATGRDFNEYMEDEVLLPLGMEGSSFTWSEDFEPPVPKGYDYSGRPVPVHVYPGKGSGGLFSTVEDIARFTAAAMPGFSGNGTAVLSETGIRKLHEPVIDIPGYYGLVFDHYGLGHFIEFFPGGAKGVSHGGQGAGWMTHFQAVPETGDGIVIITNSQRSWPFFSTILRDWARWRGFPGIGMGVIIPARRALIGLMGFIGIVLLWQVWRLGRGLAAGTRRFVPFDREGLGIRALVAVISLALGALLVRVIRLEYFFIDSVFPIASGWLKLTVLAATVILMISALLPRTGVSNR